MYMQDDSNPDFVAEVVELYFEDSAGKLEKLDAKLAAPVPDFNEVDQLVHQFKGSSASFGAQGLASLCVQASLRKTSLDFFLYIGGTPSYLPYMHA